MRAEGQAEKGLLGRCPHPIPGKGWNRKEWPERNSLSEEWS